VVQWRRDLKEGPRQACKGANDGEGRGRKSNHKVQSTLVTKTRGIHLALKREGNSRKFAESSKGV